MPGPSQELDTSIRMRAAQASRQRRTRRRLWLYCSCSVLFGLVLAWPLAPTGAPPANESAWYAEDAFGSELVLLEVELALEDLDGSPELLAD